MFCITNDIQYAEEFKVFIQDTSVRIRYFLRGKIKTYASPFFYQCLEFVRNHLEPFNMLFRVHYTLFMHAFKYMIYDIFTLYHSETI